MKMHKNLGELKTTRCQVYNLHYLCSWELGSPSLCATSSRVCFLVRGSLARVGRLWFVCEPVGKGQEGEESLMGKSPFVMSEADGPCVRPHDTSPLVPVRVAPLSAKCQGREGWAGAVWAFVSVRE